MNTRPVSKTPAAWLAGVLLLTAPLAQAQQKPEAAAARLAMERWIETRSVIGKEKHDWVLAREALQGRIDLVQQQIEAMRARIAEARASAADVDGKKAELAAENQRLAGAVAGLLDAVAALEARTLRLCARLPEPLRERVRPASQRIPVDPAATQLPLGERFLAVVGVLNEVGKFQREITVTSEVRSLGNGTSAEVTAVYLGIGQGYYVTADGKTAGVGSAGADGWTWSAANGAAAQIARVVAILKNEQPADFVPLPIAIR